MIAYTLMRLGLVAVLFVGVRLASGAVRALDKVSRSRSLPGEGRACSAR